MNAFRSAAELVKRRRQFWETVPAGPHLVILAAIGLLFSVLAFTGDINRLGQTPGPRLALNVTLTALLATAMTLSLTRSLKFLPVAVIVFLIVNLIQGPPAPISMLEGAALARVQARLRLDTLALTWGVMLAYCLFIVFIASEGRRYLRVHTEIALAKEIHQLLVPAIDRRIGRFEFFGASHPSGEVGGDLVDLVDLEGRWLAYIGDVSGHGVTSGTLMGMFKSAVRSRLMTDVGLGDLLTDVNRVTVGLRTPGMFVTCAMLAGGHGDELQFTVAGHPPILHYHQATRVVDELSIQQLPVAMFEGTRYTASCGQAAPGDVFALVSDGFIEVFDRRDIDFGLERIKQLFAASADKPLAEIFSTVLGEVRRYGPQIDDQSLLLVRCVSA